MLVNVGALYSESWKTSRGGEGRGGSNSKIFCNPFECLVLGSTVWVRIPSRACGKVASDFGLGGGFHRVLRFPPPVITD